MLMPADAEFAALCQAQLALVAQGLGASLGVVYLAQQLSEKDEPRLVPIAFYPESGIDWEQILAMALNRGRTSVASPPRLLSDARPDAIEQDSAFAASLPVEETASSQNQGYGGLVNSTQQQVVLPLMHQETVLGLLVVGRDDRPWERWERNQLNQIAHTITLGCVLDQRYQWLNQERQLHQQLEAQRHDRLDNLLHQLRNSLTTLQTFGKLLLKRLLPGDANQDVANSILREANRLKELSQQLETVLGTESQSLPALPPALCPPDMQPMTAELINEPPAGLLAGTVLGVEPCSVATILEPLLASAIAIAYDRNLALYHRIPKDIPAIQANPQALREVINNLLENALKYTPTGGSILVSAVPVEAKWVEIQVSDTGPGIPPADLPHIFERHYRGVQANSKIPGTGLGLAIAKMLIEQMQGEIILQSPADPKIWAELLSPQQFASLHGTSLTVRLPIASTASKPITPQIR